MLKKYEKLIEQLYTLPFKKMLFTIYNFIVEDGYVRNLKHQGLDVDIDDLEYMIFQISEDDKNLIKRGKIDKFVLFKNFIEKDIQSDRVKLGIFIMKEHGALVAVRPKGFMLDIDSLEE